MKKNGTNKKHLLFILIVVIILNAQGFSVSAETLQPQDEDAALKALFDLYEPVETASDLNDSILEAHTVTGLNPEQAVVNLFDYWQIKDDPDKEYIRDWVDGTTQEKHEICDMGISKGHLLRFGLTETGAENIWDYGEWNRYSKGKPYQGIVQKTLDANGFPRLNFAEETAFGNYADPNFNHDDVLTSAKKEESLAYLFSTSEKDKNDFKASYSDIQGLFQLGKDGYYYYDSKKNFAELDAEHSRFILYDSPGVGTKPDKASGAEGNYGEFFPFNTAYEVFDQAYDKTDDEHPYHLSYVGIKDEEGKDPSCIEQGNGSSFLVCTDDVLNHYIGMTLEVPFLQPERGCLPNNTPMRFEFSGDDDVWIFIDDVLVADLGGIHDAYKLSIDFSTGMVDIPCLGEAGKHTLRTSFEKAYPGSEIGGFYGDTFADDTVHTLKMFYLERGNIASNLSLSFNIQIARYNQIKKVDQNGETMNDVAFELYPAKAYEADDGKGRILCTSTLSGKPCYVEQSDKNGEPLIKFTTGSGGVDGVADFIDQASNSGYSFSRSKTNYYILRETRAPAGYRSQPVDIVLEYNPATAMLSVANKWQTGAYASFTAYANEWAGRGMSYGKYQDGFIVAGSQPVSMQSRRDGLVLAVPLLQSEKDDSVWLPLYGSNIEGFHTTGDVGNTVDSMGKALLEAALCQCAYEEGWYLKWSDDKAGLEGQLSDLPGRADRYRHVNPKGDMRLLYIVIEPQVFEEAEIHENNSAGRYEALKRYVEKKGIREAVEEIYGSTKESDGPNDRNVNMLDTAQFMRIFRSLIYIPNEQRELRVKKLDKNGAPLNGAKFGIYENENDAKQKRNPVAEGTTASIVDKNGVLEEGILIFKPRPDGKDGYARMVWADAAETTYYLREISAPDEYKVNETIIPIVVGTYSVYADAGTETDGVSVEAGVGQLCQTMAQYAVDGEVDITLRDIIAIAQEQDSGNFKPDGWQDTAVSGKEQKTALHYGINSRMEMDYGLHNGVAETTPFFKTETGFLRARVIQNAEALDKEIYEGAINIANWDNLEDTDLTGLFGLLNVVVVEDRRISDDLRELRVLKVDEDGKPLNGAQFGLYNSREDAEKGINVAASGTTANVNGQDGVLVFQSQAISRAGFAQMAWNDNVKTDYLYLKEISAPNGYRVNKTIIPVVVEEYSVYADAGTEEDGVSVMAGVGCLRREETKYADDSDVSMTLREITATAQGQASEGFDSSKWMNLSGESVQGKDLHYGINREMGMDYGLHDEAAETTPFFTAETGFIRTRVAQNTEELRTGKYHDKVSEDLWADLDGQDLTEWFSQLNIVVVKDKKGRNPQDPNDPDDEPDGDPGDAPDDDPNSDGGETDSDTEGSSILKLLQSRIGTPQTGDGSMMWWWALLGGVSLLGIGATVCNLILAKKRQKEHKAHLSEEKKKPLSGKRRKKHPPEK